MLPGQVREIGADHLAPFAAGAGGHRHRLPGLTRANRLVTTFELAEDGAGGVGEVGFEGEALAVDLDGC